MSSGKNILLASNELGDFLAGVFSPLAFLFLFLGYRQQSLEIQKNTNELKEQKRQLLLQSQPSFHFKNFKGEALPFLDKTKISLSFQLSNSGPKCWNLFFTLALDKDYVGMLPQGTTDKEFIDNNYNLNHDFDFTYTSEYLNYEDGNPYIYLIINYFDLNNKLQIQSKKIFFKKTNSEYFVYSHNHVAQSLIY